MHKPLQDHLPHELFKEMALQHANVMAFDSLKAIIDLSNA